MTGHSNNAALACSSPPPPSTTIQILRMPVALPTLAHAIQLSRLAMSSWRRQCHNVLGTLSSWVLAILSTISSRMTRTCCGRLHPSPVWLTPCTILHFGISLKSARQRGRNVRGKACISYFILYSCTPVTFSSCKIIENMGKVKMDIGTVYGILLRVIQFCKEFSHVDCVRYIRWCCS